MTRSIPISILHLGAILGTSACGSGSTSNPADAGLDDVATNPDAVVDTGGTSSDASEPADASVEPGSDASDAGPPIDGFTGADASEASTDGALATCPGTSAMPIECSQTCFGNCEGLNDASVADPSVHLGNCVFVAPGNRQIYCAPYGAADPCSFCP